MGLDPVSSTSWRRLRGRWFIATASLALALSALVGWLVLRPEPWREFVPWCGRSFNRTLIEGPIRERFLLLMGNVFDSFAVERLMRDGRMFLRGEGFADGRSWSLDAIEMNFQHRIVGNIARGITIDDVFFPPPPALIEEIRASEAFYGPYPRRDEQGRRIYGSDPRFENCYIMRAAILKKP